MEKVFLFPPFFFRWYLEMTIEPDVLEALVCLRALFEEIRKAGLRQCFRAFLCMNAPDLSAKWAVGLRGE
jgi:hypothetical protein